MNLCKDIPSDRGEILCFRMFIYCKEIFENIHGSEIPPILKRTDTHHCRVVTPIFSIWWHASSALPTSHPKIGCLCWSSSKSAEPCWRQLSYSETVPKYGTNKLRHFDWSHAGKSVNTLHAERKGTPVHSWTSLLRRWTTWHIKVIALTPSISTSRLCHSR